MVLAFVAGCAFSGFTFRPAPEPVEVAPVVVPVKDPKALPPNCDMHTMRIKGYAGVSPLLALERPCESERLKAVKADIGQLIEQYRKKGVVTAASVYLRDLERGDWTVYNDAERYDPGSLLKVPVMMAYLRASESDPHLLQARYSLPSRDYPLPYAHFPPKGTIETGRAYSVPELIHHSIARSDNWANLVLLLHMDGERFKRIFQDLSLPYMEMKASSYPLGARDYSIFMRTLFNASYLNTRDSEFAVAQLAEAEFDQGLRAGVPRSVRMAHKFGESGNDEMRQLHESAIVYLDGAPYVLTVMTKGKDMMALPAVLKDVAALVHGHMTAH